MGRQDHIASEELLNYVEGQANGASAERIRIHLATGCHSCAAELAAWSRTITHLASDRGEAVPEAVRQRAFAIMEATPPVAPLLERIIAVLTFDSRTLATLSPARTQAHSSLELLYEANNIHIALLCHQIQGDWHVAGQLLSEATAPLETNWQVSVSGPSAQSSVDTDEWNEFRLPELRPGAYTVTLRSPSHEIVLPEIELPNT